MEPRSRSLRRRVLVAAITRALRMPRGHHHSHVAQEQVPMRDGVQLLTDVHTPAGTPRGTVLMRTPYGRAGLVAHLTAGYVASHGYRVVNQSCRGTFGSGGDLDPFRHEVADGADTVAWLRQQTWFDGRFALWGASYLGYAAWALMMDPPPELVAAVVAVTAHDSHWVAHGSGAFSLEEVVGLMDGFGHLETGAVRSLLRGATAGRRLAPAFEELPLVRVEDTVLSGSGMPFSRWLTAADAEDPAWRSMRLGQALDRVDVPVLLQEGWQDPFPEQMIEQYERLSRRGVEVGLTIGPWTHAELLTKGARIVMAEAVDWLAVHLAQAQGPHRPSPVRVFVTGAREWRHLATWPPASTESVLYLQPRGRLGGARPSPAAGPTTFAYDPADPTPSVGGRVINPARAGRRDNEALEQRSDVLTFTSAPLTEPLDVMGNPVVELAHRTDNPHADLFVRVCDVDANGRSTNVSDGFRRLEPERPDGTVLVRLEAVAHRFAAGNRLRLQVSGGAHPRYARNLGTGQDPATGTALASSRRTICHGAGGFSRLLLPCVTPANGTTSEG